MTEQGAREMTIKEILDCGTYGKDDIIRILEGRLSTLRTEIQRLKDGAWRPISEAPRDDLTTLILGVNMRGDPPHIPFTMKNTFEPCAEFTHASPGACWRQPYAEWPCYPTHWQPLPSPPDNVSDKGGG